MDYGYLLIIFSVGVLLGGVLGITAVEDSISTDADDISVTFNQETEEITIESDTQCGFETVYDVSGSSADFESYTDFGCILPI